MEPVRYILVKTDEDSAKKSILKWFSVQPPNICEKSDTCDEWYQSKSKKTILGT